MGNCRLSRRRAFCSRKRELRALDLEDKSFRAFAAAVETSIPGDLVLEGIELVGALGGMSVAGSAFAGLGLGDVHVIGGRELESVFTIRNFVIIERELLSHLHPGIEREC